MRRFLDIITAAVVGCVFGAGIGFLQGYAAFTSLPTDVRMGLSGWAAWTGCGLGLLAGPLLRCARMRHRVSLRALGGVLAIASLVGISSAWLLVITLGAGWISCFITPIVAIGLETIFSKKDREGVMKGSP